MTPFAKFRAKTFFSVHQPSSPVKGLTLFPFRCNANTTPNSSVITHIQHENHEAPKTTHILPHRHHQIKSERASERDLAQVLKRMVPNACV